MRKRKEQKWRLKMRLAYKNWMKMHAQKELLPGMHIEGKINGGEERERKERRALKMD